MKTYVDVPTLRKRQKNFLKTTEETTSRIRIPIWSLIHNPVSEVRVGDRVLDPYPNVTDSNPDLHQNVTDPEHSLPVQPQCRTLVLKLILYLRGKT
jgi:hypothetical protein